MQPDGQLLGGRYALDELIATGGMGQVWRARDTVLGREVAAKVLRREFTADPTFLARFRAEAQHAAGLVHQNIATLFDYGEVPGPDGEHLAYLVMELVRGESLSTVLHRDRRLSVERTLDVLRQSATGLAAAHAADVVHRDIKPGNVLLGDDGSVKLTDFGVAVSASSLPLTKTGEVVGTANYLSPEQAEGKKATPASDVYALGLIGYEALAGHRGFDGGTPTQIALRQIRELPPPLPADVPEPVRRLIDRAIVKDPAQRFAHGAAFRAAIDDVLAGRPLDVAPVDAGPRTLVMPAVVATGAIRTPTPPPPVPRPPRAFVLPPDEDELVHVDRLDELDDDAEDEPRRRWPLVLAAALLAVLVLGGGAFALTQLAADPSGSAAPPPSSSSSAPPTVTLVSLTLSDYVGRPVGEVQGELAAQGLPVTVLPQETADAAPDTVLGVSPIGQLAPGTPVTVTYAVAPTPPPPPPTPTPTPTPEAAPTPTPEATPTPAEDTGDDNGDDSGDDDDDDRRGGGRDGRGNGRGGNG